jgi:hypothetical protein
MARTLFCDNMTSGLAPTPGPGVTAFCADVDFVGVEGFGVWMCDPLFRDSFILLCFLLIRSNSNVNAL